MTVGTSADLVFTVRNAGLGFLTGRATAPGSPFSIVDGTPFSVGPGQTETVIVRFTPLSGVVFSGNVDFMTDVGTF